MDDLPPRLWLNLHSFKPFLWNYVKICIACSPFIQWILRNYFGLKFKHLPPFCICPQHKLVQWRSIMCCSVCVWDCTLFMFSALSTFDNVLHPLYLKYYWQPRDSHEDSGAAQTSSHMDPQMSIVNLPPSRIDNCESWSGCVNVNCESFPTPRIPQKLSIHIWSHFPNLKFFNDIKGCSLTDYFTVVIS